MTVDVESNGARMVLHIGPVERALLIAAGAGIIGLGGWSWDKLNDMSDSIAVMSTQQAITNSRLDTLTIQLADIPAISRQVAEMRVQIDRNTRDIHDLDDRNDSQGRQK